MLQFEVTHLFGVVFRRAGAIVATENGLQLVFHEGEHHGNILDAKVTAIPIEWKNLIRFTPKKSVFGDSLTIEVRDAAMLQGLPGAKQRTVTLAINKSEREEMEHLVQQVDAYQSGTNSNVDEMIDDIRDFLTDY